MAYPPNGDPGAPPVREVIPAGRAPTGLCHNDLHGGNVIFGDAVNDVEHGGGVPILKMIDFGLAKVYTDAEGEMAKNIRDIGLRSEFKIHRAGVSKTLSPIRPDGGSDPDTSMETGEADTSTESADNGDTSMVSASGPEAGSGPEDTSMASGEADTSAEIGDTSMDTDENQDGEAQEEIGDTSMETDENQDYEGDESGSGERIVAERAPSPDSEEEEYDDPEEDEDNFKTFSEAEFRELPLSHEFRALICRCTALNRRRRPTLPELLDICQAEVDKFAGKTSVAENFRAVFFDAPMTTQSPT
ncbi:Uu.00g144240.m01.CDS01 [Anthostomella pinea]|uniref:Uu.00g144240.m01.CDS01 n=1 Tax=Anthostomella pinea TaxID=933095 RepID=A0AAI8VQT9_9PEZI|nr:Uu.00g144240.m01.CDS01 [Anthostomella pinea]